MSVFENYQSIQQDIIATAQHYKRNPKDITLVAVTKGCPLHEMMPAYDAGCRNFGESRLQEALPKIFDAPHDIHWHLIGTLQKNKVRKAVEIGRFTLIHSVDTPELAEKISEISLEHNFVTSILLQVNISGETSKHGLNIERWRYVFEALLKMPGIKIEGLMTMAPLIEDEKQIRGCFERLRKFRDELQAKTGKHLPHLSMGMSHDYRFAIAEGATLLRIGTKIFKE